MQMAQHNDFKMLLQWTLFLYTVIHVFYQPVKCYFSNF